MTAPTTTAPVPATDGSADGSELFWLPGFDLNVNSHAAASRAIRASLTGSGVSSSSSSGSVSLFWSFSGARGFATACSAASCLAKSSAFFAAIFACFSARAELAALIGTADPALASAGCSATAAAAAASASALFFSSKACFFAAMRAFFSSNAATFAASTSVASLAETMFAAASFAPDALASDIAVDVGGVTGDATIAGFVAC
mmetsp:Transcript_36923/g.72511  ORF Transcript_36923/g.72511 Transcript_36923/m.72511 type:complete len:203 (-) Transcript_36923:753-1361(-)